jgi:hypothetical protein
MDPEPAMLALAGQAAAAQDVANTTWVLGSDRDLAALSALLGQHALAALTIANAIHLTAYERLFAAALRSLSHPASGREPYGTSWNSGWKPGWNPAAEPTRNPGSATRLRSVTRASPISTRNPSTTPAT